MHPILESYAYATHVQFPKHLLLQSSSSLDGNSSTKSGTFINRNLKKPSSPPLLHASAILLRHPPVQFPRAHSSASAGSNPLRHEQTGELLESQLPWGPHAPYMSHSFCGADHVTSHLPVPSFHSVCTSLPDGSNGRPSSLHVTIWGMGRASRPAVKRPVPGSDLFFQDETTTLRPVLGSSTILMVGRKTSVGREKDSHRVEAPSRRTRFPVSRMRRVVLAREVTFVDHTNEVAVFGEGEGAGGVVEGLVSVRDPYGGFWGESKPSLKVLRLETSESGYRRVVLGVRVSVCEEKQRWGMKRVMMKRKRIIKPDPSQNVYKTGRIQL
ncbi:argonaute family protein [Striga asiatica]|uniref:Argonaute family protein n=1 Tax=Striga asiatica TaxID=4170 RepID=A0A5A7P3N6_STRAF|nr:argonaute family protein [Striga asiatica]